jgi:O-succinylbenzoate synthase
MIYITKTNIDSERITRDNDIANIMPEAVPDIMLRIDVVATTNDDTDMIAVNIARSVLIDSTFLL